MNRISFSEGQDTETVKNYIQEMYLKNHPNSPVGLSEIEQRKAKQRRVDRQIVCMATQNLLARVKCCKMSTEK